MKVKILISFTAVFGSWMPGAIAEIDDADAKELIAAGYCEFIGDSAAEAEAKAKAEAEAVAAEAEAKAAAEAEGKAKAKK